jgi:hypothetical protein
MIGENLEQLHEKSRSLISLTTLIASINNKGHPTLAGGVPPTQNQMNEPTTNVILDAVTMLLVRSNEVVAVAAISEQTNPVVVEAVDVIRDGCDDDDLQDRRGINQFIRRVIAVPNPDKDDNYISKDSGAHQCILINDGATSHLSRIDTWRYNLDL